MTPHELYDGVSRFIETFYAPGNLLKRMARNMRTVGIQASLGINYHLLSSRAVYKSAFGQRYIHNRRPHVAPAGHPATQ